jgi:hypothetical protein
VGGAGAFVGAAVATAVGIAVGVAVGVAEACGESVGAGLSVAEAGTSIEAAQDAVTSAMGTPEAVVVGVLVEAALPHAAKTTPATRARAAAFKGGEYLERRTYRSYEPVQAAAKSERPARASHQYGWSHSRSQVGRGRIPAHLERRRSRAHPRPPANISP